MASVTRSAHSNRQDRRAAWERRFLEATEQLLDEGQSFTDLSVDRLAGAAGTSRATFYVYFEDKGDLLRQLAKHVLVEVELAARRWWESPEKRDRQAMLAAMQAIIATYRKHRQLLSAVVEAAGYDKAVADDYYAMLRGIHTTTREIIEQGQADGIIREMPADAVAGALTWMVERVCNQMMHHASADDEDIARGLVEIIWATLYLEPFHA
jgi:TetR/AcrR family transcriptional regulator, ethionamide resistance regulator